MLYEVITLAGLAFALRPHTVVDVLADRRRQVGAADAHVDDLDPVSRRGGIRLAPDLSYNFV